ncbi:COG1470 family protein [Streptomyces agglomeratus]|uniref:COG1470 family protein n=1 Tax=Streptomyces agglomeratus TaxID=285458 RepID=UPI00099F8C35|nr:hypothetical protein [Streptomyces agglomeratus]
MQSPRRARRTGRLRAAAASLVPLCALAVLPPTAAAADGRPSWTAAPSGNEGREGGGRPYFYLEGVAGTVFEDELALTNPGAEPRTVRLRGTGPDGGSWIVFASAEVRIPPRTRADVPFTVTVPPDTAPGDHPGAIAVSGGGDASRIRVHLRVSGPTLAALTVEDVVVRERGGGAVVEYALVNRGNTPLTPRLAVRADGLLGGELLRRAPRTLPVRLAPGDRVERTEPWPGAPALDAVDVHLTATAAGAAPAGATASASFVPWGTVAGAALLVAAGAGGALWYVRRRGTPPPSPGEPLPAERHLARSGAGS